MRLGKEFKGLETSPGSQPFKGFLPGDFRAIRYTRIGGEGKHRSKLYNLNHEIAEMEYNEVKLVSNWRYSLSVSEQRSLSLTPLMLVIVKYL